jgi:serine/threonine-protein kinase
MTSALAGLEASPASYRDDLAPELDELCRRATAADRTRRISSARELGEAVQRYLDGDRDLALRRTLARAHFERAYRANEQCARGMSRRDPTLEVSAMREAGRALALDPTLPGAAELVSWLMLQPSARTPAAVVTELEEAKLADQTRMSKIAIAIYGCYAGLAPLLFVLGIRDLPYLAALVAVAIGNIAIAKLALTRPRAVPRIVIAIGHAVMFGLIARMFTPLLIAPGITAVTLMAYAQHPATTRRDLLSGTAVAIAAVLGVLGAEACGWIGATTIVDDGVIRLVSPLDGAAQFPIIPVLCCYVILLVAIAVELTFNVARRGRDARRELHVRAWQLRQLASLDAPAPDVSR